MDIETNIFTDIFEDTIKCIKPNLDNQDMNKLYKDLSLDLDNDDLVQMIYLKPTIIKSP